MKPDQHRIPVEFAESYICSGGVNVVPLLMASRAALLDRTEAAFGAGTLTDEQYVSLFLSRVLVSLTLARLLQMGMCHYRTKTSVK